MTQRWGVEQVLNEDMMHRSVHYQWFNNASGQLLAGAFRLPAESVDHRRGISANWDKYSTPELTRAGARKPDENGVISLNVGEVRQYQTLDVEHTPQFPQNRAHCDIIGAANDPEAAVKLLRISHVQIVAPTRSEMQ